MVITFSKFTLNEVFENDILMDNIKMRSREIAQWEVSAVEPNDLRPFGGTEWGK